MTTNIESIEKLDGYYDTIDLEVDHPDHQFYLANGVLTSNSHAVGYAFVSYYCAYMFYHYREYYLAAYLEAMSGNDDDKSEAFSLIKSMGYKIVPLDINHATKGWTYIPDKQFMPSLCSIDGLGETAADEIMSSRPYKTFEDILWDENGEWKPSKFNKRSLESLIKIGAFNSLNCVGPDKLFSSYAHMYHVVIECNQEIRKSTKKDPFKGKNEFYRLVRETRDTVQEWTRREFAMHQLDVFGSVDVNNLIEPEIMEIFDAKGIKPVDRFEEQNVYWFCVLKSIPKKTKNNKQYMQLEVQGSNGKIMKMFCWGVKPGDQAIEDYSICFADVTKSDFGYATQRYKLRILE